MSTIPRYTAAIRKIFDTTHTGVSFGPSAEKALDAGYQAMVFNGVIWAYGGGHIGWIETPFKIADFQF